MIDDDGEAVGELITKRGEGCRRIFVKTTLLSIIFLSFLFVVQ